MNSTPILPMRYGNYRIKRNSAYARWNSDPTYEAWKLLFEKQNKFLHHRTPILPTRHGNSVLARRANVSGDTPILPMRHGNTPSLEGYHRFSRHSDPTYEAWKPSLVRFKSSQGTTPILPMRHGNRILKQICRNVSITSILPMRHGNRLQSSILE